MFRRALFLLAVLGFFALAGASTAEAGHGCRATRYGGYRYPAYRTRTAYYGGYGGYGYGLYGGYGRYYPQPVFYYGHHDYGHHDYGHGGGHFSFGF